MTKPVLLFGYGNLSRGDDALGILVAQHIEAAALPQVEVLTDFQLQIEHALDLEQRELVLFVDASVAPISGFVFTELQPARDDSYTTHAMSPAAVLAVYQNIKQQAPPPSFLLSIKGEQFELGADLTANAQAHLQQACDFITPLLSQGTVADWRQAASS